MRANDPNFARRFPESLRLRLLVAQAASFERIQDAYVEGGVGFVESVKGWMTLPDAVRVYLGEAGVPRMFADEVENRLLARTNVAGWEAVPPRPELQAGDWYRPARWVQRYSATRQIRKATAAVVKLAASRAEDRVLEAHAQNAATFAEVLRGVMWAPEAIGVYLQALDLNPAVAGSIYQRCLAALAPRLLAEMPSPQETLALAFPPRAGEQPHTTTSELPVTP